MPKKISNFKIVISSGNFKNLTDEQLTSKITEFNKMANEIATLYPEWFILQSSNLNQSTQT